MHAAIQDMLQMQNQFRILHWQTKSYAAHKAFGKAYEALDELIDSFVETALGRAGADFSNGNLDIKLFDIKEVDLNTILDTYRRYLSEITVKLNPEIDSDLLNIRDEMLGVINHTSYLLTLK